MAERVYTEQQMLVGVALGGPVAGAYYFWRTLRALSKPRGAVAASAAALTLLGITIGCMFIPALDRIPNAIFYGLQFGLVLGVTRGAILEEMSGYLAEGKPVYSWGNTILVAVVSMVITLGALLMALYVGTDLFDGSKAKQFGTLKHEIIFDPEKLTEAEVDRIAAGLTYGGFFDEGLRKVVDVTKSEERFIISIYLNESARDDTEIIALCKKLRSDVQKSFPVNPIVLDLFIETPENLLRRIE